MTKVMFICLGNVCRSAMAKYIFTQKVEERGLEGRVSIDSSGTGTVTAGFSMNEDAQAQLDKHNIKKDNHIAKRLTKDNYNEFDYLVGMDDENIKNILNIVEEDNENKVYKLLDFTENSKPIADPWFTKDFDTAYKEIEQGCTAFLDYLEENVLNIK